MEREEYPTSLLCSKTGPLGLDQDTASKSLTLPNVNPLPVKFKIGRKEFIEIKHQHHYYFRINFLFFYFI